MLTSCPEYESQLAPDPLKLTPGFSQHRLGCLLLGAMLAAGTRGSCCPLPRRQELLGRLLISVRLLSLISPGLTANHCVSISAYVKGKRGGMEKAERLRAILFLLFPVQALQHVDGNARTHFSLPGLLPRSLPVLGMPLYPPKPDTSLYPGFPL